MLSQKPIGNDNEDKNKISDEILGKQVVDIVREHAICSRGQLNQVLVQSELLEYTLGELVSRLRAIKKIPCVFEHDRTGRFVPATCKDAGVNAGCGHQEYMNYSKENPTNSAESLFNQSAAKALEESLDLLAVLGEDVRDDRCTLRKTVGKLYTLDRAVPTKNNNGIEVKIEDVPELQRGQEQNARTILTLRSQIMGRLMKKIRQIQNGELPTSRYKEELSGLEFSSMWGLQ